MTLLCNITTLNEITIDNPNMTVKAFLEGLAESLEGSWSEEDIEYEMYLAELDRDYRSNNMNYI